MAKEGQIKNDLALFGGERAVKSEQEDMFKWPVVTERHEQAVLKVLRAGGMSGFDLTKEFEKKYAQLLGREYGLAYHNGTAAILGGLYGMGIGVGDEVIVPSLTYWATVTPAYNLGIRLFSPMLMLIPYALIPKISNTESLSERKPL